MAVLKWDQSGQKFYETGVKYGVLYPQSSLGTYPKGYAWNGLTTVTETPSGAEANPQYADDIKYLNLYSAEEFGATIEAFTYPDVWAECDGSAEIGSGVYMGQQGRKSFGLCYRTAVGNDVDGSDHAYKLHLVYGAMASPSERAYSTINDSPEPITFSWEMTTTPVPVEGYKPTSIITVDSRKVSPAKLAELEAMLYGTANADPYLPLPAEVIELLGEAEFDVTLNRSNATIEVGEKLTLTATTSPAGKTVTWASGNTSYATVADGVVTGVAAGSTTITASFTEDTVTYSDTCAVKVVAAG